MASHNSEGALYPAGLLQCATLYRFAHSAAEPMLSFGQTSVPRQLLMFWKLLPSHQHLRSVVEVDLLVNAQLAFCQLKYRLAARADESWRVNDKKSLIIIVFDGR
jgi:hypothetical protein